jgi:cytochrome c oxidase subunit 2
VRRRAPAGSTRRALLARLGLGAPLVLAVSISGCGGGRSILSPHSPQTHLIALLWWWMLGAAGVVFLGAMGLLGLAWIRRRVPGLPLLGEREQVASGMVIAFGIVVPMVVLIALFGAANLYVIRTSAAPSPGSTQMTIDVIGHQWWWEVRYPGSEAVTANEIHIPVGSRINLVATTADVIHSFWVPPLARKIDMIPGRENRVLLYASSAGTYSGQCSEFCGPAHTLMGLKVLAEPATQFRSWLSNMARPAVAPAGAEARAGERLFMNSQCASCHQIRGTAAQATVGPDLTHLATRSTLAAATIANTPAQLAAWIRNPQAIKPGDRMPDLGLPASEVSSLAAFLGQLR